MRLLECHFFTSNESPLIASELEQRSTSVHTKMLDMYWRFRQFRSDMMKLVKSEIGLENGNNRSSRLLVTRRV